MHKRRRSARRRARTRPLRIPAVWLSRHLQEALASLGRLSSSPLQTAMTVGVIAIAIALPSGLYLLTRNLNTLSESWSKTAAISLFLTKETEMAQAQALARDLEARPTLTRIRLISPDEALAELASHDGFSEAIAQLQENPLPVVLALQVAPQVREPEVLERLATELEALPQVDFARLDTRWVRRFQAILSLVQRGGALLGGTLAAAVLLAVGNTVRLEIENRRSEIEIMELVGATPGFIRRPFLYTGCWYGLLGGIGAWIMTASALILLQGPVSRLAKLYHTQFPIAGLEVTSSLALLGGSMLLGLIGSWISVGRHLTSVEPH
jgi:cell division transport system permease protein